MLSPVNRSTCPEYLAAADLGLLLRDQTTLNRVASPVKFGEYLASGTPVIMTPQIGDFSSLVARKGLGTIIDLDHSDDELRRAIAGWLSESSSHETAVRCIQYAREALCWSANVSLRKDVYENMVANPTTHNAASNPPPLDRRTVTV